MQLENSCFGVGGGGSRVSPITRVRKRMSGTLGPAKQVFFGFKVYYDDEKACRISHVAVIKSLKPFCCTFQTWPLNHPSCPSVSGEGQGHHRRQLGGVARRGRRRHGILLRACWAGGQQRGARGWRRGKTGLQSETAMPRQGQGNSSAVDGVFCAALSLDTGTPPPCMLGAWAVAGRTRLGGGEELGQGLLLPKQSPAKAPPAARGAGARRGNALQVDPEARARRRAGGSST